MLTSHCFSRIALVGLLCSALIACGGGSVSFNSSSSSSSSSGGSAQALSLSPITRSSTSARTKPGFVVIKDQTSLSAQLNEHFGGQDFANLGIPGVDFSRQTVLAVFVGAGASPCNSVQIESVTKQASGKLLVIYREVASPPAVMCVATVSGPMDMIAADVPAKDVGEVEFVAAESSVPVIQSTVDAGSSPGIKQARNVVITDTASFNALIKEHLGDIVGRTVDTSTVDFTTRSVLGVFLGSQVIGCTQAQIDGASLSKSGTLSVMYRQIQTAPGTCPYSAMAYPMHLITVDVAPGAIRNVVFNTQTSNGLIPFSVLDYNPLSSVSARSFETATNQQTMASIWAKHNGSRQTLLYPNVDFSKVTLGALFHGSGSSSCATIHAVRVESAGKNTAGQARLKVSYDERAESGGVGGACAAMVTMPSELITIPIANAELNFSRRD